MMSDVRASFRARDLFCNEALRKYKSDPRPKIPVVESRKMKLLSIPIRTSPETSVLYPQPKIGLCKKRLIPCLELSILETIEKVLVRLTPSPKGLGARKMIIANSRGKSKTMYFFLSQAKASMGNKKET